MSDLAREPEQEVVFTMRELQPLYDILVRISVAQERVAAAGEESVAIAQKGLAMSLNMTQTTNDIILGLGLLGETEDE